MIKTKTIFNTLNVILVLVIAIVFLVLFSSGESKAAWYDSDYQYCREMTMTAGGNSGGVATTTTAGFALVATSTISDLAHTDHGGDVEVLDDAQSATSTPLDVIFTDGTDCNDDSGSVIDFYFEQYASTTGAFTVWLEAGDISSTTAKSILMYYGNSGATNLQDEAGVWGASDEIMVHDLHEDPADDLFLDGTANNWDAGETGGVVQTTGYLGNAIDFDGGNDRIVTNTSITHGIGTGDYTMSVWTQRQTDVGRAYQGIVANGDFAPSLLFEVGGSGNWGAYWSGDINTGDALSDNTWYYLVEKRSGSTISFYRNGVLDHTTTQSTSMSNANFIIGAASDDAFTNNTDAVVDDVRFYSRGLDPMDILTIYNNTSNSATFWSFGSEETEDEGDVVIEGPPTGVGSKVIVDEATMIIGEGTQFIIH